MQALHEYLVSERGEELCRFLRDVYYVEDREGSASTSASPSEADGAALAACRRFELIRDIDGDAPRVRLTAPGYEVANVAKEYCNWIDGGRALPVEVTPEMVAGKRVLDAGCSFGRQMLALGKAGARCWGVDLQAAYLRLAPVLARRERLAPPTVARSRVEALPFGDGAFDVVLCRLVLNCCPDVRGALREFHRVLAPGGLLVLHYETMATSVRRLLSMRWRGNGRKAVWRVFSILNSLLLEATGRQVVVRVRGGRMYNEHSPTAPRVRGVRSALRKTGFDVAAEPGVPPLPGLFHARRPPIGARSGARLALAAPASTRAEAVSGARSADAEARESHQPASGAGAGGARKQRAAEEPVPTRHAWAARG